MVEKQTPSSFFGYFEEGLPGPDDKPTSTFVLYKCSIIEPDGTETFGKSPFGHNAYQVVCQEDGYANGDFENTHTATFSRRNVQSSTNITQLKIAPSSLMRANV